MNRRIQALLLASLMTAGMTMEAARPSFFQRSKNSITKFFNNMPTNVKWGAAFIMASVFFYLSCSGSTKGYFSRRYADLIDSNEYAGTVLPANGNDFNPVDIQTARGHVRVEQIDVARQNIARHMATCGQHAVTQANVIVEGLVNNDLETARARFKRSPIYGKCSTRDLSRTEKYI